jgi:hypothetical protein
LLVVAACGDLADGALDDHAAVELGQRRELLQRHTVVDE